MPEGVVNPVSLVVVSLEAAKEIKGIQRIAVKAYIDPTAYSAFKVREDIVEHFGIKEAPEGLATTDVVFQPKKKAGTVATTKKIDTVTSKNAGSRFVGGQYLIGKAIRIPCGTGLKRNIKGVKKDISGVTIRVPSHMTDIAICLWINTCFGEATKKPKYFVSSSGATVFITPSFTDKANLPNKKNE